MDAFLAEGGERDDFDKVDNNDANPTAMRKTKSTTKSMTTYCTKWLGEFAGGTTWVGKMKVMEEGNEQEEIDPTLLFNS